MTDKSRDHPPMQRGGGTPFWVTSAGGRVALIALHLAALVVVVIEWVHPLSGSGHGVERLRKLDFLAAYSLFGFVACVILVLLGRVLRRVVIRDEDYYRDSEP